LANGVTKAGIQERLVSEPLCLKGRGTYVGNKGTSVPNLILGDTDLVSEAPPSPTPPGKVGLEWI
jgi:hypothetical protein